MTQENEQASPAPPEKTGTRRRYVTAVLVGLAGAIFMWIVTPLNNLLVHAGHFGDSFLPLYAMFVILVIILLVNPLLRRFLPRFAFRSGQLGLILAILLIAASLPHYGGLISLPYTLAGVSRGTSEKASLAQEFKEMDLSPKLFPDSLEYNAETPVAQGLITELPPGEPIPWGAWLWPLLMWGTLLLFMWMMMIGLALIVFPQWRRNERLAFPILTVFEELTREPEKKALLPPLFRNRVFWITAASVFVLHLLEGASHYNPERVPAVPLGWNLQRLFSEDPWRFLPRYIYETRFYFAFIGIAYFMPNRISFSVWFFAIAYALYRVVLRMYFPGVSDWGTVSDHRAGAYLMLAAFIVWLGRAHWAHVFRCVFRRPASEEDARDRTAGIAFLAGCFGIWVWLVLNGMQWGWALTWLGFAFVVAIVITRIVAETGVPFVRSYTQHFGLMKLAPTAWISAASIFFSFVGGTLISLHSRVCAATMATHGLGLNEAAGPRRQRHLALVLIGVLVLGLVICGATHLSIGYRHGMSLDGRLQPLGWFDGLSKNLQRWLPERRAGELSRPTYGGTHVLVGMGMAGGLQWACLSMPKWPIHPVGILLAYTSYGRRTWFSIFVGWLIKTLLVRFGGARLFRAARPAFLGLIVGEILAAVFWGIVPSILLLLGHEYKILDVLPF